MPAEAHPHAFIALRTILVLNRIGHVKAVREEWEFDENYAATALDGLDANNDSLYSAAELAPLTDENIKSLREYDYFTVIRQKGEKQTIADVKKASQSYDGGILRLVMDMPLVKPLDPSNGEIQIKVYDPEFFIAYDYQETDPFMMSGALPAGCSAVLLPLPTDSELEEKRDYLAEKSPDWKPDTDDDFGSLFAQPLRVICGQAGFSKSWFFATVLLATTTVPVIDKGRLLVQQREGEAVSLFENPATWVMQRQRTFYGKLSTAMRSMKTSNTAVWTLLSLSFAYGILHAAGPGHGKAVISTWLLATENDLRRGVIIAFLSALMQALSAIILVSALYLLVARAGSVARNVAGYLESASYAMIAMVGLYLIWTTFKPGHHVHADHGHHAHHDHHTHVARPKDLRGDWSLTKAFSLAFATGIRPCTGAILVLVFANSIGLYWAGIASTLAMGIGVFLTVAMIAAITIFAKQYAMRFAIGRGQLLPRLLKAARLLGGVVIVGIGIVLFLGSLSSGPAMV
jgi:nickel/cobalt transporter (NicO) family protein